MYRRSPLFASLLLLGFACAVAPDSVFAATGSATFASTNRSGTDDTDIEQLDPPAMLFGEVMFDYYNHRNFPAITNLLIARQEGVLSDQDYDAEMLLGDLYTSFGLVSNAEEIFSRIINKKDILPKTRNETWFHTAEIQYGQGKYDEAARILENKITNLSPQIEKERVVMLGNIYIGRGEYQRAADLLATVRADDIVGAFALYNAGVAFIRSGESERGMPLLKRARDLPPGDEETNALKDRAALAIGFTWLQKTNNDLARESLLTIRMDGPFTNQAMLGLGYANFQRGDYKKALPLWLELLQRNTSDTTVQEALMLAPRAYEELGALPQALFGYRYAADTLRNELKKVERTIVRVRESDWLDTLSPVDSKAALSADPLAPVTDFEPANIPEAPYLYSLFASNQFASDYKLFLDLQRTQRLIDYWLDQLPIYQAMLDQHRQVLAPLRMQITDTILRRSKDVDALRARVAPLEARLEQAIDQGDIEQTATIAQLDSLDRVKGLETALARAPAAQNSLYAERLRRVKGLLMWDITEAAKAQQEQTVKDLETLKNDLDMAQLHIAALDRQRQDLAQRMGSAPDQQIASAAKRLQSLKDEVKERMAKQAVVLQNQALVVLAENRRNLGSQLAETHLAIARLQDQSVSEAIEKKRKTQ